MAKCNKCGNEQFKPRVSPFPVSFIDVKTKKLEHVFYNAGISDQNLCWFCTFPR